MIQLRDQHWRASGRRTAISLFVAGLVLASTAVLARDGDGASLTPRGRTFAGLPLRVAYADPYLVTALDTGIEIYDARLPSALTVTGRFALPSPAYDFAVVGSRMFIANGESGLAIVDIADPATPTLLSTLPNPLGSRAAARAVAVAGTIAYLAEAAPLGSSDHGLRAVDITDPLNPIELGYLSFSNGALAVAVVGQTALVGLGSELGSFGGLVAVDVSDPTTMVGVSGALLETGIAVHRIAIDGNHAYLAVGDRLTGAVVSVDIANPAAPVELGRLLLTNGAMDLSLVLSRAYVATRESGLLVVDITRPGALNVLGKMPADELTMTVASRGDTTFIGTRSSNGRGGVVAVNSQTPQTMSIVGQVTHSEATAVVAVDSVSYLLRRDSLDIFDQPSSGSQRLLGSYSSTDPDFSAVDVEGSLAAICEGRNVQLVDVSNPAAPALLSSVAVARGIAVRATLAGNTLFVVNGRGLELFNISSPTGPSPLARLDVGTGTAAAMALGSGYAYLVGGEELIVIDVTNPAAPVAVAQLNFVGDELRGIAVDGAKMVLVGSNNLYTIDLTVPNAPTFAGLLSGRSGFDVRIIADRAIVAAGADGVRVVDITDPLAPTEVGYFDTSGEATTLATDGTIIHLSTMSAQHWTFLCDSCQTQCVDSWPSVAWNSLRAIKSGGTTSVTWSSSGGNGTYNLHRTGAKSTLPNLFADMSTVAVTSATTAADDTYDPTLGTTAHYRVFGAGLCDGASHGP